MNGQIAGGEFKYGVTGDPYLGSCRGHMTYFSNVLITEPFITALVLVMFLKKKNLFASLPIIIIWPIAIAYTVYMGQKKRFAFVGVFVMRFTKIGTNVRTPKGTSSSAITERPGAQIDWGRLPGLVYQLAAYFMLISWSDIQFQNGILWRSCITNVDFLWPSLLSYRQAYRWTARWPWIYWLTAGLWCVVHGPWTEGSCSCARKILHHGMNKDCSVERSGAWTCGQQTIKVPNTCFTYHPTQRSFQETMHNEQCTVATWANDSQTCPKTLVYQNHKTRGLGLDVSISTHTNVNVLSQQKMSTSHSYTTRAQD